MAGASDGTAWVFNVREKTCESVLSGHTASINQCSFLSSDEQLMTVAEDGLALLWDALSGTKLFQFPTPNPVSAPICFALPFLHPDTEKSHIVAIGMDDASILIQHTQTGRCLNLLRDDQGGHSEAVNTLAFSPTDPSWLVSGGQDGKVVFWDLNKGSIRLKKAHDDAVLRVMWHPVLPMVFSASADASIRIWDARNGHLVQILHGHEDVIWDMDISMDGKRLVTTSDDKSCRVFSLPLSL